MILILLCTHSKGLAKERWRDTFHASCVHHPCTCRSKLGLQKPLVSSTRGGRLYVRDGQLALGPFRIMEKFNSTKVADPLRTFILCTNKRHLILKVKSRLSTS